MNKSFNKFGLNSVGIVGMVWYYDRDEYRHNDTKQRDKKLIAQANRRFIKALSREEFLDLIG
jgi:hypothetical protein